MPAPAQALAEGLLDQRQVGIAQRRLDFRGDDVALGLVEQAHHLGDQHGPPRSARQRLEPERAGAGEKVENIRADDLFSETGEDRGFHAVHGRPHFAFRDIEPDASRCSGDHSHGVALGEAVYVREVLPATNTLVIGRRDEVAANTFAADGRRFIARSDDPATVADRDAIAAYLKAVPPVPSGLVTTKLPSAWHSTIG